MKLQSYFILTAILSISFYTKAQNTDTTYWTSGGFVAATFSQVTLSDSWAAGGATNVSLTGATGLFADYAKGRSTWESSLDLGYGQINQDDQGFEKSDDKIIFVTKYGYQIKEGNSQWYFSGLLDFKSQFAYGYDVVPDINDEDSTIVISQFMAPGYLTLGLGIDYKPNKKLSINYIPLTGKFTFVTNQALADQGAYGVDSTKNARAELGSFLRIKYKNEVIKNVNVESRLELFTNYIENFGTIDVNWQTTVVMKVNKVLSANLFTHLLYDEDIKMETNEGTQEARVQFKSVFGVGLAYNFGAQRDK
ncbi:MAG: DUF3078 domain-containing protein [Marinoscillum sp.]